MNLSLESASQESLSGLRPAGLWRSLFCRVGNSCLLQSQLAGGGGRISKLPTSRNFIFLLLYPNGPDL